VDRIKKQNASGPNAIIRKKPDWHAQARTLEASLNDQCGPLRSNPILIDTFDLGNLAESLA